MTSALSEISAQPAESSAGEDGLQPMSRISPAFAITLLNATSAKLLIVDEHNKVVDGNTGAAGHFENGVLTPGDSPGGLFGAALERAANIGSEKAKTGFELQHNSDWYDTQVVCIDGQQTGQGPLRVVRAVNITDRKLSEFQVMESEARLEEATRIARMGTYRLYWDTKRMLWSHQMYEIHGVLPNTYETSTGRYAELVHPEDRKAVVEIVKRLLSGEDLSNSEYRIIRPNDEIRWLRLEGRVLFDADGKPYATFGTLQDITEAKQREEDLRQLLERNAILTEALQSSPVGVAVFTPAPENPEIYYVNPSFEFISGRTSQDLRGRSIANMAGPGASLDTVSALIDAFGAGRSQMMEAVLHRPDGTSYVALIDVAPVWGDDGRLTAYIVNMRDITDDRRRTEAMMESQKMEALGKLSGGVAHEINNLLQPIITLSDLGGDMYAKDAEKAKTYFDVIASSGRKARDVVRQILTFSRQDAPEIGPHEITSMVDGAVKLSASGLSPDVRIEASIEIADAIALINPTQVSQAVINLIRNAADAMPEGGVVNLRLHRATPVHMAEDEIKERSRPYLRLSVADAGVGMSEATKAKVFEPFFTTKPVGQGTGLGLSVVYSIVHGWGGTIRLHSEVDKGTTVVLYIPEFVESQ